MKPILLIGYGNTLRSDDGAGQIVATTVANWQLPHVLTLAVQQLTPELAEPLSTVKTAIFVDAYPAKESDRLQLHYIAPDKISYTSNIPFSIAHTSDPRFLLSITKELYNNCPPCWWLLIPGFDFSYGEQISPLTQQAIDSTLEQIKLLVL